MKRVFFFFRVIQPPVFTSGFLCAREYVFDLLVKWRTVHGSSRMTYPMHALRNETVYYFILTRYTWLKSKLQLFPAMAIWEADRHPPGDPPMCAHVESAVRVPGVDGNEKARRRNQKRKKTDRWKVKYTWWSPRIAHSDGTHFLEMLDHQNFTLKINENFLTQDYRGSDDCFPAKIRILWEIGIYKFYRCS